MGNAVLHAGKAVHDAGCLGIQVIGGAVVHQNVCGGLATGRGVLAFMPGASNTIVGTVATSAAWLAFVHPGFALATTLGAFVLLHPQNAIALMQDAAKTGYYTGKAAYYVVKAVGEAAVGAMVEFEGWINPQYPLPEGQTDYIEAVSSTQNDWVEVDNTPGCIGLAGVDDFIASAA